MLNDDVKMKSFSLFKAVTCVGPAASGMVSLSGLVMENIWLFVSRYILSVLYFHLLSC